jgi:AAHS family 4-hydroxybenzoate transporter-like MFS transporter
MARVLDVQDVIDRQSRRSFQMLLMIWMSITMMIEGFDNQVQGYTAPAIIKAWHISTASFTPVFGFFQAGFMFGVALLGNLGDILGRRTMIVAGVLLFGVCTIAGAYTTTVTTLTETRFCAAFFLGGAIPNALALAIEYAPRRRRAVRVGVLYVFYTLGASAGGFLAARLVPAYGWPSIYHVGGWVAVALSVVLFAFLPESAGFLIARGRNPERLRKTLQRLMPDLPPDAVFVSSTARQKNASVAQLFTENRTLRTVALWTAGLFSMVGLQFMTSWLPTVFTQSHVTYSWSVVALACFQAAGAVGGLAGAWALDRPRGIFWLACLALLCAPVVASFPTVIGRPGLLVALVAAAGFCIVGTQTTLNALGGVIYPTAIRSTGSGWAYGIGRIGAILGPVLGGILIAAKLQSSEIFPIIAIPPLCVAAALFTLNWFRPQAALETRSESADAPHDFAEALYAGDDK